MKSLFILLGMLGGCISCSQAQSAPAATKDGPAVAQSVLYVELLDTVPQPYRAWYAVAEHCLGLQGNYDAVRWYTTPRPWGDTTWAMWQTPHRITINAKSAMDSAIVIHESKHDILAWNGLATPDDPHPAPYFGGTCP